MPAISCRSVCRIKVTNINVSGRFSEFLDDHLYLVSFTWLFDFTWLVDFSVDQVYWLTAICKQEPVMAPAAKEANFFLCLELNPTIRILEVHQWVSHQNRWKIGLPSLEKQKWRLHGCWHFGWGVDIKAKSATSWKSLFLALVAMSDIQCWRRYEVVMKIVGLFSAIHLQLTMISELVGTTYLV